MTEVYQSARESGHRTRAVANLLYSYGRLYGDPETVRDLYNCQSSVGVTARELALMGATLAAGGKHPITQERVVHPQAVEDTLAIMMITGM